MLPSEISVVRLIKIPDAAPPYDCETHGTGCPAARDVVEPDPRVAQTRAAGSPADRAQPGEVPAGAPGTWATGAPKASPAGAPGAPLGAAGMTAPPPRQFAQVIVEILAGVRSPGQIVPWTTDRARAQMRCLAPLLVSDRRPRIQRIVTSRPAAGAVEMTVIVSLGPRSRALALRLEHMAARPAVPGAPARPARWLCTEIEAGLPSEGPLGVRAHPRVSVAALELAARSARARVVAPDASEVVARRRAAAALHMGPAVEGWRRILELLSAPWPKAGR
jgi:Family of unknown function (DUF6459)